MLNHSRSFIRRWRIGFVLLIILALSLLAGALFPSGPAVPLADLPPLSLTGVQRLLVLAPHCDDETLGSAGLILAAQKAGIEVRVVIATNGDGYLFATMEDFHKIYPRPQDFIRMGELRQQESLGALAVLHLEPQQVSFLSYPDRGSPALWNDHWSRQNPYRSPYSQDTRSPYAITYNPESVYAGEDYLADLTAIIADYRPDLIVYPHADDVHPDHWALNTFTRLAVTLLRRADAGYAPTQLTYLVHRPDFPVVRGLKPQQVLVPPPKLYAISPDWFRWDLIPQDVGLKHQAVLQYQSQLPTIRGLMESFIRANELFAAVTDANLAAIAQADLVDPASWKTSSGQTIAPVQLDPIEDFVVRDAVPGADLVAVYAARDSQGVLHVCSQLRGETDPELLYRLRVKSLTGSGVSAFAARTGKAGAGWLPARRLGKTVCAAFNLAEMGDPWAVYVGADVEGAGRVMDEAAWQMVYTSKP